METYSTIIRYRNNGVKHTIRMNSDNFDLSCRLYNEDLASIPIGDLEWASIANSSKEAIVYTEDITHPHYDVVQRLTRNSNI